MVRGGGPPAYWPGAPDATRKGWWPMLTERTERDYRQYVTRWERDGRAEPVAWVASQSSPATRRNARTAWNASAAPEF